MINAEGKPRNANTIITPRQYLQDACFTAFICGEKELIEEMAEALQNPKWVFFLGRKSCVPSCPVFNGIVYDKTAEQALLDQESFPVRLRKNEPATARILYETPSVDNPTYSRSDEIVDMGKREFRRRDITLKYMEVKNVSE
jgi:CRISPR system Cascade subunit CasD